MSTAQEIDRDGFTAAERAYFASGGRTTEGLLEPTDEFQEAPVTAPAAEPTPAPEAAPAATATPPAATPDPNADPWEELERVAKDNRTKTGKLIPEANFRVVSEKYKSTKQERDELKRRLDAIEKDATTWRTERDQEREMRARIDERLKLFNEVIAPAADPKTNQPAPPPNPEEDIFGYLKWQNEQQERRFAELADRVGQTADTIQTRDTETNLRNTYQQDAVRFAQTEAPDFAQAYGHLNKVRDAMLESIGYSDPKERAAIRMNEERELVDRALKAGKSPASVIYGVAKSLGWVKPADPAPAPAAPAAAPGMPAGAAQSSVTAELERIQKAQAASKTLSGAGGAAAAPMTVQALAEMSEAEFEAYARKNPAVVRQLMGG